MIIETFAPHHLEQALLLSLSAYARERQACPSLPDEDFAPSIRDMLTQLMKNGYGVAACDTDGRLVGHLLFYGPMDGFFGNCRGVFSPLGGFAVADARDREKTASMLFEAASQTLLEQQVTSYGICVPAHDEALHTSLTLNGFGIRCADAVTGLQQLPDADAPLTPGVVYRELPREERLRVNECRLTLISHLSHAPTFMPAEGRSFEKLLRDGRDTRLFVAEKEGKVIGFIELCAEGENYATDVPTMRSICGACFTPESRGTGAALALLRYMQRKLQSEGYKTLGVDCETLNPTALRFWGKYFDIYTHSFNRRIDERVIGYQQYLDTLSHAPQPKPLQGYVMDS